MTFIKENSLNEIYWRNFLNHHIKMSSCFHFQAKSSVVCNKWLILNETKTFVENCAINKYQMVLININLKGVIKCPLMLILNRETNDSINLLLIIANISNLHTHGRGKNVIIIVSQQILFLKHNFLISA